MQNRVQGFGVKGLLETIMKVSKSISLLPWVFLQMSRKRRLLLQGWEPIRTIIKVGQNEWLPPLGGWQMPRKWRTPRRAAGTPRLPLGSRAEAGRSSKTPFYQPALQPGARAQSCRAVWMACHTPTWDKHALSAPCVFRFSCSARLTGAEIPAERCLPPPRRHYLASQLPVRLNLGSSGLSAPPCQPCTATASSCRTARKVQGQACAQATCKRPWAASRPGRSWQCPSHSRRHRFIPYSWGRCPRRGFESSDYLTAADTKPIFLPLPILSIVTDIFIQDLVTVSSRASFLLCF